MIFDTISITHKVIHMQLFSIEVVYPHFIIQTSYLVFIGPKFQGFLGLEKYQLKMLSWILVVK